MQLPPHVAHTGAAGALFAWLITLANTTEPVISAICGIVGIISGCFAIAWYRKRLKVIADAQDEEP